MRVRVMHIELGRLENVKGGHDQRATLQRQVLTQNSHSGSGSDRVWTGSLGSGRPPNLELDFRSGSAPMPNFGPDLGPVHQSSGLDQSSEPNCGNTSHSAQLVEPTAKRLVPKTA